MAASQGATTAAAKAGVDTAALAQKQALQALSQSGQLAGEMGSTEFNQAAQKAAAIDAINKFNAQNQQNINLQNVQQRNLAQSQNLGEKQRVADVNAQQKTQQAQYEATLPQQTYENKMRKAAALAAQYGNMADVEAAKKKQSDIMAGGLIGTGGQILASAWSDENLKKEIAPADHELDTFMEHLNPKKFKFKNPKMGKGPHFGVIAQHLEKDPVGKAMVEDTPNGKMIRGDKALGTILASLGRLHEKVGRD
jgi:hypothetical protein